MARPLLPLLLCLLLCPLFLTSCIDIEVEQRLHRNGHYDLDLTFSTGAEYAMLLDGLKEGIRVDPSVEEKFALVEEEGAVTYSFADIDPTVDKRLFLPPEEAPASPAGNAMGDLGEAGGMGDASMSADLTMFSPENVRLEVEKGFPYTTYTYTIIVPGEEPSEEAPTANESIPGLDQALGDLFSIDYTLVLFGTVVETNGQQVDGQTVTFDVGSQGGEYTVTFKDFFLASLLGDKWMLYLLAAVILLAALIATPIILKVERRAKERPFEPPVNVNPQLLDYVRKARARKMGEGTIKANLLQAGWKEQDVEIALHH